MADVQRPPSVPVDDNWTVWVVPGGFADVNAPKVSELTATTTADTTCYLTHKKIGVTADQSTYQDPRLCSSRVPEKPGAVTEKADPLEYIYNPQAALTDAFNKAQQVLQPNTVVGIGIRRGVAYGTEPTAGQFIEAINARMGVQNDISEATGGVFKIEQSYGIDNRNVKVALV